MYLYSAQYLHILQDSKRYLTNLTVQVQPQLTSLLFKDYVFRLKTTKIRVTDIQTLGRKWLILWDF